jgi:hypothetical protein
MTSKPVRVFVTTCDKYIEALRPMAYLINKYWKPRPEVVVGGFTPPGKLGVELPPNFHFHSIGKQEDYPIGKWTDAVIEFVSEMPDEVFVLMLEDMWPVRGVDGRMVQMLADYMHQFRYVARIDLTGDRLYAHGMKDYGRVGWIDLIISMPGSPYHLSMMPGLWRKEHLLSTFRRGWSPWEVELQGTPVLAHNRDVIVLGTRQWPYRNILAFRGGDSGKLLLDGIDEADVNEMRKRGYLEPWEGDDG